MTDAICSVDGCTKHAKNRGWCSMHYERWRRHGDVGDAAELIAKPGQRPACSVPICDDMATQRGLCGKHYGRLRSFGHPMRAPIAKNLVVPLAQQMWRYIVREPSGCWRWGGSVNDQGYGLVLIEKKSVRAHRAMYELIVGPIPEGLQIDHLCRNRACVNPAHLEPVTQRENLLRGEGMSAIHARKTHCIRGHEFTPENTYHNPSTPGSRTCRECMRIRDRARR